MEESRNKQKKWLLGGSLVAIILIFAAISFWDGSSDRAAPQGRENSVTGTSETDKQIAMEATEEATPFNEGQAFDAGAENDSAEADEKPDPDAFFAHFPLPLPMKSMMSGSSNGMRVMPSLRPIGLRF